MTTAARRPLLNRTSHHRRRSTRTARTSLLLAAVLASASCSSQAETAPLDASDAYAAAVASLERAAQGTFSVSTMADSQEIATVETNWQLEPGRHRSTTQASDPSGAEAPVRSTVVEDSENRWTLAPAHHEQDDCWVRTAATGTAPGTPGALRLLLEGNATGWEHAGAVLLAEGPASAVLDAVGPLGETGDLSAVVAGVPDSATVEFSVLVTEGKVTALKADLGSALRAAQDAGGILPEAVVPFASTSVTIEVLAGFHDLTEDVDTAPPAEEKVRTCS